MVSLNRFKTFEEPGDTLSGRIVGSRTIMIKGVSATQFLLINDEGLWTINSTAQLDTLRFLPTGTLVEIEYQGVIKGSQNVKRFDVRLTPESLRMAIEAMSSSSQPALPSVSTPDPFEE
jgi:hypothetical protein